METLIALIVIGILVAVYGGFVFAGNLRCFSILAGGGDFLALNPSEAQYRREARRSGAAIFLLALDFWCFGAWNYAQQNEAVRTACLVVGIVAALGVVVLIALSLKTHADLLKEHHG
ncbi:translation initiation factor IF-2 [Eggerthella guodeyinii]|uniref:Translation initiation factor IF-2 n=1 Tax=Eggerthella guodeyinii TaxID=2690837 RepID=A0A6L7IRG5_9ACTN|nr:translation initiation factor IF-2 [Eggerthella guodeyinii]QOS69573.1 translation initiation factor IF-2 [Eggerthella guodeyinii]